MYSICEPALFIHQEGGERRRLDAREVVPSGRVDQRGDQTVSSTIFHRTFGKAQNSP